MIYFTLMSEHEQVATVIALLFDSDAVQVFDNLGHCRLNQNLDNTGWVQLSRTGSG